jgi:hypothetical protein
MPRKNRPKVLVHKKKGGKRPGSGRPKGSVSYKTQMTEEERAKHAEAGMLPLEYMLRVMRDGRVPKARRDDMCKAAAPYLHARLSSVEVKNKKGEALKLVTANMTPKEASEAFLTAMVQPTFEDEEPTQH